MALLDDMLQEARFLRDVASDASLEDLLADPTLRRGVERSLEILGEAAKALPAEVRERWPQLPWSDMAKMRDVLIHAYHRTEPATVLKTAQEHAAPLVEPLEEAIRSERRRSEAKQGS